MEAGDVKLRHENVLLIDDEEIDLFINEKIISNSKFAKNIFKVRGGNAALEFLKNAVHTHQLPSLIFLDLNMPVMNGFDFLDAFERLPVSVTSRCRIVILSSSSHDSDRSRVFKFNAVFQYLNKPLNERILANVINQYTVQNPKAESDGHVGITCSGDESNSSAA